MKQKSLLLITVDCLRADHVGFHGYRRGTTPFLDSLAPASFVLPKAIVAGAPTYFSFPAIMASRYPLALGRDVLGIAPQEPTLATSLQEAGYETAAFVAGNPYLSPRFGYHQGFAIFQDFLSTPLPRDAEPCEPGRFTRLNQVLQRASRYHASASAAYDNLYFRYCQWRVAQRLPSMSQLRRYPAADVIVDQARSWLSRLREKPFFLWLHLMDPHHPYFPPEQAVSELACGDISARRAAFLNAFWSREDVGQNRLLAHREEIVSLYDAGIYWADKQISRLATALQHLPRWDDTVLAVTADHGEEFLENEARYHPPTTLSERLVHVPLLIRVPGLGGVPQPNVPFSLIHLGPTLLDVLHVRQPASFRGSSWWPQIKNGQSQDAPVIVECVHACQSPFPREHRLGPRLVAVRDTRYKLVLNFHEQTERLFDLANDPSEHRPLDESVCKLERARLLRMALQHLQSGEQCRDPELRLRARASEIQQLAMGIRQQKGEPALVSAS
jgi:arylsulfatase A-like enzyme